MSFGFAPDAGGRLGKIHVSHENKGTEEGFDTAWKSARD
jgi:hypothetical protein